MSELVSEQLARGELARTRVLVRGYLLNAVVVVIVVFAMRQIWCVCRRLG
ncbi:MAG: hypothetical protein ACOYN0_11235 [Phycisphaerales bacterium]